MPPTAKTVFVVLYVGLKMSCRLGVTHRSWANRIFQYVSMPYWSHRLRLIGLAHTASSDHSR